MATEAQIRFRERVAASKAERAARPKIERHWVTIKDVPEHVESEDAKLALRFLLQHADYIEMMQFPKDQSQYKAHFGDGVYKGEFVFTFTENGLTPIRVYEKLKQTGWPGFSMSWLNIAAREEMKRDLSSRDLDIHARVALLNSAKYAKTPDKEFGE